MIIKVLGMGWARCNQLETITREVVAEMKLDATIEHVKDMKKIMEYPILRTPGLVIAGKLICSGRVPTKEDVAKYISAALGK